MTLLKHLEYFSQNDLQSKTFFSYSQVDLYSIFLAVVLYKLQKEFSTHIILEAIYHLYASLVISVTIRRIDCKHILTN